MTPLKIHNCGSYSLVEYLTCWKCVIFHAFTASCFCITLKCFFLITIIEVLLCYYQCEPRYKKVFRSYFSCSRNLILTKSFIVALHLKPHQGLTKFTILGKNITSNSSSVYNQDNLDKLFILYIIIA